MFVKGGKGGGGRMVGSSPKDLGMHWKLWGKESFHLSIRQLRGQKNWTKITPHFLGHLELSGNSFILQIFLPFVIEDISQSKEMIKKKAQTGILRECMNQPQDLSCSLQKINSEKHGANRYSDILFLHLRKLTSRQSDSGYHIHCSKFPFPATTPINKNKWIKWIKTQWSRMFN